MSPVALETAVRVTPLSSHRRKLAAVASACWTEPKKASKKEGRHALDRPLRRVMGLRERQTRPGADSGPQGTFWKGGEELNIREHGEKPPLLWRRWRSPVRPSQAFEDQPGCPPSRSFSPRGQTALLSTRIHSYIGLKLQEDIRNAKQEWASMKKGAIGKLENV